MKKNVQPAFTLVELLIVIALLGALAVGLLASLDPFEQFKKGTDTGIRNTVSEIHGSVIRYYSIKNFMPWSGLDAGTTLSAVAADSILTNVIQSIIDTGELKKDFANLAATQLPDIYLTGDSETVTVCFRPTSKSFRANDNTKYNQAGVTMDGTGLSACASNIGSNTFNCYWCVQ